MPLRPAPAGLRLARIDTPDAAFNAFTYPRFRAQLDGTAQPALRARQLAVGAWLHGLPVGLAYLSEPLLPGAQPEGFEASSVDTAGCMRQLLSVMVQPLLRGIGIGRLLLEHAAQLAAADGTLRLHAVHSSRLPARAAYEALLRAAGWSDPVLHERRIVGKARWIIDSEARWAPLRERWRAGGYSADPWSSVGDAEREELARIIREQLVDADRGFDPLVPRLLQGSLPELSLLLRRHGRIVGWLIGWPGLLPDSVWYAQGYVLPEVQAQGWLLAGMRDVSERQLERMGPDSLCMFHTSGNNAAMQRLMERRFGPHADWTDARYLSEKALAPLSSP